VAAAVKIKQKVLGFKLDDKAIYAWFCEDLKSFASSSLSLFKKKAQNNFWVYPTQELLSACRRWQESEICIQFDNHQANKVKAGQVQKEPANYCWSSTLFFQTKLFQK
jgi:hypothetical protein